MISIICVFWGQGSYSQFGLDHVVSKTKLRLVACKASALPPVLTLRTGFHFFFFKLKNKHQKPMLKGLILGLGLVHHIANLKEYSMV